jgi:hypothetical protein
MIKPSPRSLLSAPAAVRDVHRDDGSRTIHSPDRTLESSTWLVEAWPRPYAVSPDAPWWQLWALPLVLGSILGLTTLYVLIGKVRGTESPESSP